MKLSVHVLQTATDSTHFYISQSFISKAKLKLAKNSTNTKQYPEAGILLFENSSYSSSNLSSKNNRTYSRTYSTKKAKGQACLHSWNIRLIKMKMKIRMINRSHRHDINRSRPRDKNRNSKYKKCLIMMIMLICIKQHLRNICSSI